MRRAALDAAKPIVNSPTKRVSRTTNKVDFVSRLMCLARYAEIGT